jgi:ethanolamine ammonia-lyase small subunit
MSRDDHWTTLRRFTAARIGLGRSGSGLPTAEVLKFSMAHALARDAVHTAINWEPVEVGLAKLGLRSDRIESAATSRDLYLRRPDLGRSLSPESRKRLAALPRRPVDLAIIAGDGLSSNAATANLIPLLTALKPIAVKNGWRLSPVLLATQSRVALGDEAAEFLGAKAVLMLIGERPGLSSPDSLGAYLTWQPRVGLKDAERNCVSNIRVGGLSYDEAAFKLAWLIGESFRRQVSGVNLKDDSNYQLEAPRDALKLQH